MHRVVITAESAVVVIDGVSYPLKVMGILGDDAFVRGVLGSMGPGSVAPFKYSQSPKVVLDAHYDDQFVFCNPLTLTREKRIAVWPADADYNAEAERKLNVMYGMASMPQLMYEDRPDLMDVVRNFTPLGTSSSPFGLALGQLLLPYNSGILGCQ
jgi:hypothetical protein